MFLFYLKIRDANGSHTQRRSFQKEKGFKRIKLRNVPKKHSADPQNKETELSYYSTEIEKID